MHSAIFSSLDTILLMFPFLAMMAMGMFRLDERIAAAKDDRKIQRHFCGEDQDGQPHLSDPDGRPCSAPPVDK